MPSGRTVVLQNGKYCHCLDATEIIYPALLTYIGSIGIEEGKSKP